MTAGLEELATTADEVAADQRNVVRQARKMQRQRDGGWPSTRILDEQPSPGLLDLLRRGRRRTAQAASSIGVALAVALDGEGQFRRQIARRLGIAHQRVSAMLNGSRSRTDA